MNASYKMFSTDKYYSSDSSVSSQPFNYYNLGVFAQAFWTYEKLNVLAGTRYDYHSIYKNSINPRIAINYRLRQNIALRLALNSAHRTPSSYYSAYSYSLTVDKDGLLEEDFNTQIKVERLQSLELGFLYTGPKKSQIDLTFFHSIIEDKIDREITKVTQDSEGGSEFQKSIFNGFVNRYRTQIGGLKLSLLSNRLFLNSLDSKLSFSVNYAKEFYSKDENEGISNHVFNVPKFFALWNLTYRVPIDHVKLSIEINQSYCSSYYQGYVFSETINGVSNVTKTEYSVPSYYLMDLGVRYVTSSVRLEIFGYLRNVFANKYGGISATKSPDDIYFNPQQGRRIQAGVSYRLGLEN